MTSFSRVFAGSTTFPPPEWHAAQLFEKTLSPAAKSAAKAGAAIPIDIAAAILRWGPKHYKTVKAGALCTSNSDIQYALSVVSIQ